MQYVTACKHELSQLLYELYFMYFKIFFHAFYNFLLRENFFDLLSVLLFIVSARE